MIEDLNYKKYLVCFILLLLICLTVLTCSVW